ncbi:hypothetical protein H2201_002595 [Coniosporium apollinis]|uniref:Uncharacterized protein n=1 Tax=Coniosporium apollinis TaxID=61459 RepID=A0ABQ9NYD7_9PEZI|nr:hypothetical protein H2201_002595 [Coniosporium apollinis]
MTGCVDNVSHTRFHYSTSAYITPPATTPPPKPQPMSHDERNAAVNAQLLALLAKAQKDSLRKNPATLWMNAPAQQNTTSAVFLTSNRTHSGKSTLLTPSLQPQPPGPAPPIFRMLPYSAYSARITIYSCPSPNAVRTLLLASNSSSDTLNPHAMYFDPGWEQHELPASAIWLIHLPGVLNVEQPGDGDVFGFVCGDGAPGEGAYWACVHAHLVHLFTDWCGRRGEDGEMLLALEDFVAKGKMDPSEEEHEVWYARAKAWVEREFPPG